MNAHGFKNITAWRIKTPGYQDGDKNPAWKDGLSRSTIRRTAQRVLNEAGINQAICADCKLLCPPSIKRWNIHHIDGNRAHNTVNNLIVLCPRCHNIRHKEFHESRRNPKTGRYISTTDSPSRSNSS